MRESNSGQYIETLGNKHPDESSPVQLFKVGDTRPPTLVEVMLDPEFLQELHGGNVLLLEFLDVEKMLQVADFVIQEPKFQDSAERCF